MFDVVRTNKISILSSLIKSASNINIADRFLSVSTRKCYSMIFIKIKKSFSDKTCSIISTGATILMYDEKISSIKSSFSVIGMQYKVHQHIEFHPKYIRPLMYCTKHKNDCHFVVNGH